MKKYSIKIKLIAFLIVSLLLQQSAFAGTFFFDNGVKKYLDDNGMIATGWRWLDTNGDNICECYRFGDDGALVSTYSKIKGKEVNAEGKWIVDGIVQQIYKSTGKPLKNTNINLAGEDTNNYIVTSTDSKTKKINATNKDIVALIKKDKDEEEDKKKKSTFGPDAEFVPSDKGYVLGKGAKLNRKVPTATRSNGGVVVNQYFYEEEVRYLKATESLIAGRDARAFVTSSNKYTKSVNNAKIYGGEIWNDVICLAGNGASIKLTLSDTKSKFKANYFRFEVAHQTHGESTADTNCYIELYVNGQSVSVYDGFLDDKPEIVEEYLDDGDSNIELKAVVSGDTTGRKIYLKNFRLRQIKDKDDDE